MDSAERIETLVGSMRNLTRDREELDAFTLGAVRGCFHLDLEEAAVLDHIQDVLAADALVRAERR